MPQLTPGYAPAHASQDLLICGPIVVLLHDTILPLFVRYKIKEHLDSAMTDPIVFKNRMPPGTSNV